MSPQLLWEKSNRSNSGGCLEVAVANGFVLVRDSKDPHGPRLAFSNDEWNAFLGGIEDGQFRLSN